MNIQWQFGVFFICKFLSIGVLFLTIISHPGSDMESRDMTGIFTAYTATISQTHTGASGPPQRTIPPTASASTRQNPLTKAGLITFMRIWATRSTAGSGSGSMGYISVISKQHRASNRKVFKTL